MPNPQHSPLPHLSVSGLREGFIAVWTPEGLGITDDMPRDQKEAVCRAVNNHAALVQALRLILDNCDYTKDACNMNEPIAGVLPASLIAMADKAIAAAQPTPAPGEGE